MTSRKEFLTAAAAVPLVAAAPSPAPTHAPAAAPKQPKISQLAMDFAKRARSFDPSLTDAQIQAIAEGIDGNLGIGGAVNPKGEALKNWNEPATIFEVPA